MEIRIFRRFYGGSTNLPDDELVVGQEEYGLSKKWSDRFLPFMRRIEYKKGDRAKLFVFGPKKGSEERLWNLYWAFKGELTRKALGKVLTFVLFLVLLILAILKIF